MTLFKRGTVYLALGKARFAIQDFTRVLQLKPDFTAARIQRGIVYLKSGEYKQTNDDFEHVVSTTASIIKDFCSYIIKLTAARGSL